MRWIAVDDVKTVARSLSYRYAYLVGLCDAFRGQTHQKIANGPSTDACVGISRRHDQCGRLCIRV